MQRQKNSVYLGRIKNRVVQGSVDFSCFAITALSTFSRAIPSVLASNQNMNSNDQMGHHYIDPHSKGSKPVENHHFDHLHVWIFTIKQSKDDACEIQEQAIDLSS